jgi:hypothetical protein
VRHPTLCLLALVALFFDLNQPARAVPHATSAGFRQVDAKALPNLFVWTDTCNVYVLRDGNAALLMDLGDGSVLDHLPEIGVRGESRRSFPVLVKAAPAAHSGTRIVSLDVTLDGHRYGEWFDFVVGIVSSDATKR